MTTITNTDCWIQHKVENWGYIYNGTLCTSARNGLGACLGDSGSPLASNGQLIGLVSWGDPCAIGLPDAFTRISPFWKWIREVSGVLAI